MGSFNECCTKEIIRSDYILTDDKIDDIILPLNLSLQEILNIKNNKVIIFPDSGKNINKEDINFTLRGFKLKVFASYDEQMYPIWVDNGAKIKFKVKGKWSLYNNQLVCDSYGDLNQKELVLNNKIGCLMGRIQGGEVFAVNNNTEYVCIQSGCLYLFQNNGIYETSPNGFLDVEVLGGRKFSYFDIEKLSKWSKNILDTAEQANLIQQEKDLIYFINKLRSNPSYFCQCYFNHLISLNSYYELSCKEMSFLNNKIDLGDENTQIKNELNKVIDDVSEFSNLNISSNLNRTFSSLNIVTNKNILKPDIRLQRICETRAKMRQKKDVMNIELTKEEITLAEMLKKENILSNVYCELCTYGKSSILGILSHILIDDDVVNNQTNILTLINGKYTHIGVSIVEHSIYNWACCIVLSNLIENDTASKIQTDNTTYEYKVDFYDKNSVKNKN